MMWGRGLFGLLGLAVLILAIAALIKCLLSNPHISNGDGPIGSTTHGAELLTDLRALLVFALFTFLFHFAWEILQAPMFARECR